MSIAYTTRYSTKRKTIGLVVERDSSVVVLAPQGLPKERIEQFIAEKSHWIQDKLENSPKLQNLQPREFTAGSRLLYLGKRYELLFLPEPFEGVRFEGKFLIAEAHSAQAPTLLNAWYKARAIAKITPRVKSLARQMGVTYNQLLFPPMQYRWGSCSPKGNLTFNWHLVKTPQWIIDYIIIHELAHLKELNHSPKFWAIVRSYMPNYQDAIRWLNEHGEEVMR